MARQEPTNRVATRLVSLRRRWLRGGAAVAAAVPIALLTNVGTAQAVLPPDGGSQIMKYASELYHGHAETYWAGGPIPYVYGGGHLASHAGPSRPAGKTTTGLDCSGFTRYVYRLAWGHEVLGAGSAAGQWTSSKGTATSSPVQGNLVFFYDSSNHIEHVGVYAGTVNGVRYMYHERKTGDGNIRYAPVTDAGLRIAGYRYYSG
jgi:cell wall-associated NlpC family hydrolase